MKRYIRAKQEVISDPDWNKFLEKVEDYTGLEVSPKYRERVKGKNRLVLEGPGGKNYSCSFSTGREFEFNDDLRPAHLG